jgi:hypothetical protein
MKGKRELDNSTRARVKKEMAKPRMAKSAKIAQRNLKKGAHVEVTATINADSQRRGVRQSSWTSSRGYKHARRRVGQET